MPGAAFLKTTLIDFPGRVATAVFLPGCNFRCPYCHNAALVAPAAAARGGSPGFAEFLAHLDRRKSLISGVVISGGEPLLTGAAETIAREARARSLAVKLDTNGSFPERMAAVGADFVALDLKTAPAAYGRVAPAVPDAAERALESLRRLRRSGAAYEVRITCAPGLVGMDEAEAMAAVLEPADEVVLQPFRPGGCLDPAWDAVAPLPAEDMEALLAAIRRRAPKARLRAARGRSGA